MRSRLIKPINSVEKIQIWVCQHCFPNPVFVSREDLETHETVYHVFNAVSRNCDERVAVYGYDQEYFREQKLPDNDEKCLEERVEEMKQQVDQLNKTIHQKTSENEQLRAVNTKMSFNAKLKDGAIEELDNRLRCLRIDFECSPARNAPKAVENVLLKQFEDKEVAHLNKIIEEHENTIESLKDCLENKLDKHSLQKNLFRANMGYIDKVKDLHEQLFDARVYLHCKEESFKRINQEATNDFDNLSKDHKQVTTFLEKSESREVRLREKIQKLIKINRCLCNKRKKQVERVKRMKSRLHRQHKLLVKQKGLNKMFLQQHRCDGDEKVQLKATIALLQAKNANNEKEWLTKLHDEQKSLKEIIYKQAIITDKLIEEQTDSDSLKIADKPAITEKGIQEQINSKTAKITDKLAITGEIIKEQIDSDSPKITDKLTNTDKVIQEQINSNTAKFTDKLAITGEIIKEQIDSDSPKITDKPTITEKVIQEQFNSENAKITDKLAITGEVIKDQIDYGSTTITDKPTITGEVIKDEINSSIKTTEIPIDDIVKVSRVIVSDLSKQLMDDAIIKMRNIVQKKNLNAEHISITHGHETNGISRSTNHEILSDEAVKGDMKHDHHIVNDIVIPHGFSSNARKSTHFDLANVYEEAKEKVKSRVKHVAERMNVSNMYKTQRYCDADDGGLYSWIVDSPDSSDDEEEDRRIREEYRRCRDREKLKTNHESSITSMLLSEVDDFAVIAMKQLDELEKKRELGNRPKRIENILVDRHDLSDIAEEEGGNEDEK